MKPSEMASLSNSGMQNRKERPNRSTNIFDIFFDKIREVIRKRYPKWLTYKIGGGKTVKNVQIEQLTTKM